MQFLVRDIMDKQQQPVTTELDEPVSKVLEKMFRHDYSQLPVIEDGRVHGMVNMVTILQHLHALKITTDQLRVRAVVTQPFRFHPDDPIGQVLEVLRTQSSVLVVDAQNRLLGVVTDYDTSNYFRMRAEDIMRVEAIERALRSSVLSLFPSATEETPGPDIEGLIRAIPSLGNKPFSRLSFYGYAELFLSDSCWHQYGGSVTPGREVIKSMLNSVRGVRNKLAHFSGTPTPEERNYLQVCHQWFVNHTPYFGGAAIETPKLSGDAFAGSALATTGMKLCYEEEED